MGLLGGELIQSGVINRGAAAGNAINGNDPESGSRAGAYQAPPAQPSNQNGGYRAFAGQGVRIGGN